MVGFNCDEVGTFSANWAKKEKDWEAGKEDKKKKRRRKSKKEAKGRKRTKHVPLLHPPFILIGSFFFSFPAHPSFSFQFQFNSLAQTAHALSWHLGQNDELKVK